MRKEIKRILNIRRKMVLDGDDLLEYGGDAPVYKAGYIPALSEYGNLVALYKYAPYKENGVWKPNYVLALRLTKIERLVLERAGIEP